MWFFFLSYAFRKMKLSQIVFSALATAMKQRNVWHCAYEKESFMWLPRSFFKLCSLYGSEHPCQALWRHCGVSERKWLPSAVVCWHNHVISTLVGASPHNSLPAQESEIISQFLWIFSENSITSCGQVCGNVAQGYRKLEQRVPRTCHVAGRNCTQRVH